MCHKARCDFPKHPFLPPDACPRGPTCPSLLALLPSLVINVPLSHTVVPEEGGKNQGRAVHAGYCKAEQRRHQQAEYRTNSQRGRVLPKFRNKAQESKKLQTHNNLAPIAVVVNHFTIAHTWVVIRQLYEQPKQPMRMENDPR